jgi:Periplasmic copper-binding protein (NosD)
MNGQHRVNRGAHVGVGLVLLAGTLSAVPNVKNVDCRTHSLGEVIAKADPGDTLQVTGTCRERVVVTTDRLTIDGQGTAVIDGGGPGGGELSATILIDGARGFTVRGFTIRNGANAILGQSNSAFKVQGTTIQDNAEAGIIVAEASEAEITDCSITHNGDVGIIAVNQSFALLRGSIRANNNRVGLWAGGNSSVEVRGGTLEASSNAENGINLAGASLTIFGLPSSSGTAITTNNNGADGIFDAGGLIVFYGPPANHLITALNNKGSGIDLQAFATLANLTSARFILKGNATGLTVTGESSVTMIGGLDVQGNGTGLLADGAGSLTLASIPPNPSIIQGNTAVDTDVRFGTRITVGGAILGKLVCDPTVLSRGTTKCP